MKVIAKKIVYDHSENHSEKFETIYEVKPGETIEALMKRVNVDGSQIWHFDEAKVVLKLVKEEKEVFT